MSPTKVDNVTVAKTYFAAVNQKQMDNLAAVFAEDGVLTFPLLSPIRGRQAIREFYSGVLQFYPEAFDDVTRWFVSESGDVAAEIHFEGRTATGHTVAFDAVDVFTIENGVIQDLHIFYDSAKVQQMVGELPK